VPVEALEDLQLLAMVATVAMVALMEEMPQVMAQVAVERAAVIQQAEMDLMVILEFFIGALTNAWRS